MPKYRGHTRRLQVLLSISMILLSLSLASFNAWQVYNGLTNGVIKELDRRSHGMIHVDSDPGEFGFTIVMRMLIVTMSIGVAYVLYRWRLKAEVRDL